MRPTWKRQWPASGPILAIADAGPLYAAVRPRDPHHARSRDALQRQDLTIVVPAMVLGEVSYFVGRYEGSAREATFIRGVRELDIEAPIPDDLARMADLVEQYADFPLGGTDASVIALAERLDASVIITLDRRHFGAIRPRHRDAFELLP